MSQWMNSNAGYNITIWQTRPSLEEFLNGSLSTLGPYYSPDIWQSEPGTEWYYSSTGYLLLGYIVERVTNQPISQYVQENILSPLGMTSTGYRAADFVGRNAVAHERINGTDRTLPIYDIYDEGAGGLRSTVPDVARYMIAHMNDGRFGEAQILEPTICQFMHSRQLDLSHGAYDGFGLGWFLSADGLQGHSGTVPGYIANMRYNKTGQGSYGIILMLDRGYVLGNDMDPVDNFYSPVNQLLWQEAQRMFNSTPPTLEAIQFIAVTGVTMFLFCALVFASFHEKRKRSGLIGKRTK
jgi:CubicO group peptidase (beta-lactamase class C family)